MLASRTHIELRLHPVAKLMGGGFYAQRSGRAVIALDPDLPPGHRTAALAHELVHDERGTVGVPPAGAERLGVLVDRDERAVGETVARRLLPPAELASYVDRLVAAGEGVDADEVARAFDVPTTVAAEALRLLARTRAEGSRG